MRADNKSAIDRLLAGDDTDSNEAQSEESTAISFSHLKTDPGKASLDSLLVAIAKLKCINDIGLVPAVFQDIPAMMPVLDALCFKSHFICCKFVWSTSIPCSSRRSWRSLPGAIA